MWQTAGSSPSARSARDAADAEHDLLLDAHLVVAAVEPCCDVRGLAAGLPRGSCRAGTAAPCPTAMPPDARGHFAPIDRDGDARVAARSHRRTGVNGWRADVDRPVVLALPAVRVQVLVEVALVVEQPHAHERQTEVRGRLQVVAGEHAKAAGVVRQGISVKREFERKVGDRRRCPKCPAIVISGAAMQGRPRRQP